MTDLFEETTTTTSLDLRRLQRNQRRLARRKRTAIATAIAVVIFAVGGSVAWSLVQSFSRSDVNVVQDYTGAGQGAIVVIVKPGDTGADMARTLYEAGVVASPQAFIIEYNKNPDSSRIVPGHYFMQREMKAEFALLALLDPGNRDVLAFTIPEGNVLSVYFQRIADLTDYSFEEVQAAAKDTDALGLPPEANGNLEGWLFPARYEFNPGIHPADILAEMVATTIRVLDERGVDPQDRHRILTIASLIEREAKLAEDRPMISGVIYNRLAIDQQLEFDSTVKYLSPSEGVFTSDEERAIDSPYNTYRNTGLPPGPIAGPGASSIDAAINPVNHNYLFFVTVNLYTGETAYAETYSQHLKNVEILRAWYRENEG